MNNFQLACRHFVRMLVIGLALSTLSLWPAGAGGEDISPVAPVSTSWRFGFTADTHIFYPNQDHEDVVRAVAADMQAQHVSLALFGGDLIRGHAEDAAGLTSQYRRWLETVSPLFAAGTPVYAVPGNHEKWGKSEADETAAWMQTIAPRMPAAGRHDDPEHPGMEYAFDFKNALFIGLDEFQFTGGNDFPKMFRAFDPEWVGKVLATRNKRTTPYVFIFGHCPAFMAESTWPAPYRARRDEFWHLLERENVTLYLSGHNHVYARSTIREAALPEQLIVGTGGGNTSVDWDGTLAETKATDTRAWNARGFGYVLVTVSAAGVRMEWRHYNREAKTFSIGDAAEIPAADATAKANQ